VDGPDAAPLPVQVLEDETPVAVLCSGLTAQQHGGSVEEVTIQRFFDPAFPQQIQERPLVARPYAAVPVGVQDLTRRGEPGLVNVLRAAEPLQEKREVGATGEAGELRGVVQAYVEQAFDAGVLQRPEELGRRLLRETDRVDFRGLASVSGNRTGCPPFISSSVWTLPSPLM
jgi:hypothetical protein